MLLRRWTSYGVELALVVIGILIALAVDGWMDERHERKTEKIYLEMLVSDLQQIAVELNEQIAFETDIINVATDVVELIPNYDSEADESRMRKQLTKLTVRRTLFLDSAAYTDLTSTGNLGLIKDRQLRSEIVHYFSAIKRRELIVEKNNRVFIDDDFKSFIINSGVSYERPEKSITTALNFDAAIDAVMVGAQAEGMLLLTAEMRERIETHLASGHPSGKQ